MDTTFEHKIRQRAYEIWMAAGMSEGDAERHWLHAERVVRNEAEVPTAASETTEFTAAAVPAKTAAAGSNKPAKTKVAVSKIGKAKIGKDKTGKDKVNGAKVVAVKTAAPRRTKTASTEASA